MNKTISIDEVKQLISESAKVLKTDSFKETLAYNWVTRKDDVQGLILVFGMGYGYAMSGILQHLGCSEEEINNLTNLIKLNKEES